MIMISQLVRLTCAAVLFAVTVRDAESLPILYALIVCIAIAGAFENPARAAMLPSLVVREDFPRVVTVASTVQALAFITAGLAATRWLTGPIDRLLDRMSLEFFLLSVFGFLIGCAAIAEELGLSEAIGALMAGIVLSETTVREQIEERFFSFRDVFAALFFFVFGLSIDVGAIGEVGWIVALATAVTLVGKVGVGWIAGRVGGFTSRQGLNAGIALIAHGEFTIIIAQLASQNPAVGLEQRRDLAAFAGLYVLVTATLGIVLMKESKRIGRAVFPTRTLAPDP